MLLHIIDAILNINKHLLELIEFTRNWIYLVLFLVIFCETGLIIFPFLPGDSLLFIVGALAGLGKMSLIALITSLFLAAMFGNILNYLIGSLFGKRILERNRDSSILNYNSLHRAQKFYQRYGGKTIVLARFVPLARTFVPFIAGVLGMNIWRFQFFNAIGAFLWVAAIILFGYFFGNIKFVRENLNFIVIIGFLAIIMLFLFGFLCKRLRRFPNAG